MGGPQKPNVALRKKSWTRGRGPQPSPVTPLPPLGPTVPYNPVTIYGLSLSGLALPAQALCPLLDARFRAKKKTPILGAFYTLSTGVKYHLIKTSRSFNKVNLNILDRYRLR